MIKKLVLNLIILFFYISLQAQITQTIRGKVVDKESKTPLTGATIVLINTNPPNAAITDINGNFTIHSAIGRISLKITFVGYEESVISEIELISGKETFLTIEMREQVTNVQEITIKANINKTQTVNSMASISARMISTEDANRYAAGYSDPARMVSSFAGVVPMEGDKNNIVIRGNSPRGLLWRLEGIEIPSPNHFGDGQGDAGGSFCIINSNLMANSDFYTGAFPAEYGNALAGILDLNLRKGNANKREYAVQVGVVGTEITTEGPLGKKGGSYLLSYRYSNFKPLEKMGIIDLGVNRKAPVFQDLAFNINLPAGKAGVFSLFGVGGTSTTGKGGVNDSLLWLQDEDNKENELEVHSVGIAGLKHSYPLANRKTYIKTTVAVTGQYDKWDLGYIINRKYPWYKGTLTNNYASFREEYNTYTYPSVQAACIINHKFNANHTLRVGLIFNYTGYHMYAEEYNYNRSIEENRAIYDILVDRTNHTSLSQAFIQWKYRLTENLELNTGIHTLYFALNKHYSLEPRLGMKWQISDKSSISYGFGIHSRIESVAAYYTNIYNPDGSSGMPNKGINFTRSVHNVIGYDWSITSDIRLKAEIYHQYLYDIPIKNNPNSSESVINATFGLPDTAYSNMGLGRNYGIELTIEKFFSNNYYFLVTGSLFESKYKAGDGNWYNTVFNSNYVTNWLVGKDFKTGKNKQNIFGLNFKVFVKGGFRYTPVNWDLSGDDPVYITSQSFTEQAPYMLRFDLGLKYRKNNPKYSWIVSLDIQNLTSRKNILGYEYKRMGRNQWMEPIEGLPLIPILNFRVVF
jgi:hypothetical protein